MLALPEYNRQLTSNDIQAMITLLEQGKFQEVLDGYYVRCIQDPENIRLFGAAVASGNLTIVKYIYNTLVYDDQARALLSLKDIHDIQVKKFIVRKVCKFIRSEDYSDEFETFLVESLR